MQEILNLIIHYDFFRNALFIGFLSSFICGIVGTFIHLRKIVFITGGISHASFGGVGLAYYFQFPLMDGSLLFSIFMSIVIAILDYKKVQDRNVIISNLWIFSISLGTFLIYLSPGYIFDLHSYMFGNIFMVSNKDLYKILILFIIILLFIGTFYRQCIAFLFDSEFLLVKRFPIFVFNMIFYIIIGISISILIHSVGMILVMALFTVPTSIAFFLSKSLSKIFFISILLSLAFIYLGIMFSYFFDMPSGPLIVLPSIFSWLFIIFSYKIFSVSYPFFKKRIVTN